MKKFVKLGDLGFSQYNMPAGLDVLMVDTATGEISVVNSDKDIVVNGSSESTALTVLTEKVNQLEKDITILKVKDAGGSIVTDTTVTVTTVPDTIDSPTKDITILPTTMEKPTTITGKSVTIDSLSGVSEETMTNVLTINSTGAVKINNLSIAGTIKTTDTNQINIETAKTIIITDSDINTSGYNGIMIGQGDRTTLPELIKIENVKFNVEEGKLTNNTINIFATAPNATINIVNCVFGDASNPIRLGNSTNASGITVLIENCHFEKWEEKRPWCGVILFEAFQDWTLVQKEFPPTADEENSTKNKAYRKRVLPELIKKEDTNNRFGKDKIKVVFKNCTYGPNKTPLIFNVEDYGSLFGTGDTNQIAMVCRYSGYSSINAAYDEKVKAENGGTYPDGQTWYAAMFPYDDTINYLKEIAADTL